MQAILFQTFVKNSSPWKTRDIYIEDTVNGQGDTTLLR